MKLEILLVLFLFEIRKIFNLKEFCPQSRPQCSCLADDILQCDNFTSLNKLKLDSKLASVTLASTDADFRLNYNINIDNLNLDEYTFELRLTNLNGIDIDENPFLNQTVKLEKQFSYLHLSNSTLNFYYRKKSFEWICDLVVNDETLFPVFASFRHVFIGYFSRVSFTSEICPVVFKNAKIDWLYVSSISPNNKFKFIQLNTTNLNSQIKYFQIQSSNLDILDKKLLDKNVFKHIEKLSIEFSNLNKIEKNLFRSFKDLRRINLWLYNIREFFHEDTSWLESLNLKSTKQFFLELSDESNTYTYPDEDLCLFQKFPHSHRVFPLIRSNLDLNCTCTLVWLLSHWHKSEKDIRTRSVLGCLKEFQTRLHNCKLKEKLDACNWHKEDKLKLHMSNTASSLLFLFSSYLIVFDFIFSSCIIIIFN